jgi:hypothetical protein
MKTTEQNNESKMAVNDINDVFEQILLSEERISEESYKQGFSKGVSDGNLEAYHIGECFDEIHAYQQQLIAFYCFQASIAELKSVLSLVSISPCLKTPKFHRRSTKK